MDSNSWAAYYSAQLEHAERQVEVDVLDVVLAWRKSV